MSNFHASANTGAPKSDMLAWRLALLQSFVFDPPQGPNLDKSLFRSCWSSLDVITCVSICHTPADGVYANLRTVVTTCDSIEIQTE